MKRTSLEPAVLRVGEVPDQDVLLGARCTICERYFFPDRRRCAACTEESTVTVELAKIGTLSSYTTVTKKPAFSVLDAPYVLGEVLLPEGLSVYSAITVARGKQPPKQPSIGARARLDPIEIQLGNRTVVAYTFSVKEERLS